ncbi:hypothetical protein [Microbacterium sp. NPDC091662]|uniref:hypothetical protein n=1 Tax=Microbacterium sp. NPDC091662 TaxID=3364211 RepID=UPI00380AAE3A
MEELAPGHIDAKSELFQWRLARLIAPKLLRGRVGALLFSSQAERTISATKLASGVVLLLADPKSVIGRTTRVMQLAAHIYQHTRTAGLGRDGSDHALVVQDAAQLIAAFAAPSSRTEKLAVEFLGAQALLSYFASGYVKAISPVWRAGEAMSGVMRTSSYGEGRVYRFFRAYPAFERAAAWGVIVGETAVPLQLLLPKWVRGIWHLGLLAMHGSIARFMGLNRFFWSFAAMQPPMAYVVERMSQKMRGVRR